MAGMSPHKPQWSEEQLAEFREELEYCLDVTNWRTVMRVLGVSRNTVAQWRSGASAPMHQNRDAVLRLAKALRKAGL